MKTRTEIRKLFLAKCARRPVMTKAIHINAAVDVAIEIRNEALEAAIDACTVNHSACFPNCYTECHHTDAERIRELMTIKIARQNKKSAGR